MVKVERTYRRSSKYSEWHRPPNLPRWCYVLDADSTEYRYIWMENRNICGELKIVGFVETKEIKNGEVWDKERVKKWNKTHSIILNILSNLTKIPSFIVIHTQDMKTFWVYEIIDENLVEITPFPMIEEEYKEFIKNLQEYPKIELSNEEKEEVAK